MFLATLGVKVTNETNTSGVSAASGLLGNQARNRVSWELESKVPSYLKRNSLRIWLTIFRELPHFVYKIRKHQT